MDERDRLAASFGDMRRAMIPTFLLDLLRALEGGDQPAELSLAQLATLYLLDGGPPVTLGALADRVGRSVSATSRLVDGLARRDLLERREHPTDRRARLLALSSEGDALLRRLERTRADAQLSIMNGLSADERDLVDRAMALLGSASRAARSAREEEPP
jgi:DNA-binding MarR family transcriptional regulator